MKSIISLRTLILLNIFTLPAFSQNNVVDLGQLEVEGELRRPTVTWLDSSKRISNMLPDLFRSEFQKLERELTQHKSPQEIQKISKNITPKGEANAEL